MTMENLESYEDYNKDDSNELNEAAFNANDAVKKAIRKNSRKYMDIIEELVLYELKWNFPKDGFDDEAKFKDYVKKNSDWFPGGDSMSDKVENFGKIFWAVLNDVK